MTGELLFIVTLSYLHYILVTFLHPNDHQPHPAIIPGEETFLHPNDHQPHRPIIRGEGRRNLVGFLKFPSPKLQVSALAVCCLCTCAPDYTQALTSARDPMPCTFPGTLHVQLSLLGPEPAPAPSTLEHSTAKGETHRLPPPYSAATCTLPVALRSKTASNSAEIFSPQPTSVELLSQYLHWN